MSEFSGRWGVMDVYRARQADTWPRPFALPAIGEAAFGGFFAGIIDTNQSGSIDAADDYQTPLRYALIVAPLSLESSTTLAWRTSSATVSGASTRWNGLAAQNALASATFPAFNYCNGLSFPDDGGSKWYLPAIDELELCYRNFKPTTGNNTTGARTLDVFPAVGWNNGANKASDPAGAEYTTTVPGQTSITAFQSSNAEAFAADSYWSASWRGSTTAWRQVFFLGGDQIGFPQTFVWRVRPVRRVVL